jgi:hypothetical protein
MGVERGDAEQDQRIREEEVNRRRKKIERLTSAMLYTFLAPGRWTHAFNVIMFSKEGAGGGGGGTAIIPRIQN